MIKLKELRLEKNLSQKELAEKLGTSNKNIWAYEKGSVVPPLDVLIQMCNFFECSIDYLVGRADDFGNITVKKDIPKLTEKENQIIDLFRQLPDSYQSQVIEYTSYIVERQRGVNFKTN